MPEEYLEYKQSRHLIAWEFISWNLSALVQAVVIMTIVMYGYQIFMYEDEPFEADQVAQAALVYSIVLVVIYFRLLLNLREGYKLGLFLIGLTFSLYVIYLLLISMITDSLSEVTDLNDRSIHPILGWILLLTMPIVALIPDILAQILCKHYYARYFKELNQSISELEITKKAKVSVYHSM